MKSSFIITSSNNLKYLSTLCKELYNTHYTEKEFKLKLYEKN